jgi:cytoskeletal protein RodZ
MFKESLGEYLKQERELRHISLEEVAEGTKIAIYRLRAMEDNRWEDLPAEIFVKGFIKSYAEFIGLEPEDVLLRYQELQAANVSEEERNDPTCKQLLNYANKISLINRNLVSAAVVFLVIILLLLLLWFLWPSDKKQETGKNLGTSAVTLSKEKVARDDVRSELFLKINQTKVLSNLRIYKVKSILQYYAHRIYFD